MISALEIGFALSAPLFVLASALVTLSSVAARTPDGHTLFDNLSLAFGRERTAVVGRNGVGKTTLLRLVAGLAEPAEGAVARAGTVGWLAQSYEPTPGETVAETLGAAEPLALLARVLAGEGSVEDMAEADWTLEERMQAALAGSPYGQPERRRADAAAAGGADAGGARSDRAGRADQPSGR